MLFHTDVYAFPTNEQNQHFIPYEQNYMLPAYYTGSPYRQIYAGNTPSNQKISHGDFKFQFSFKIPLTEFRRKSDHKAVFGLDLAYTQLSYWQVWNQGSWFFRENNYEPAVFFEIPLNTYSSTLDSFGFQPINIGYVHQSNGRGGLLERSWNRIFLENTVKGNHLAFNFRIWYTMKDGSFKLHNPDFVHYLGYGRWVIKYHTHDNTISLSSQNNFTSDFSRGLTQLSWSFPLNILHIEGVTGYLQISSGYGQSLIEYDHRTNAIGLGFSFNDW